LEIENKKREVKGSASSFKLRDALRASSFALLRASRLLQLLQFAVVAVS
jgi:hypothetical protein